MINPNQFQAITLCFNFVAIASLSQAADFYMDVTLPPYNVNNTDNNDDSSAIQNAIEDAVNAGGGALFFPDGTYYFDAPVGLDQRKIYLSLAGESKKETRLICRNNTGIFNFAQSAKTADAQPAQYTISDMSLLAGRPSAGTALKLAIIPAGSQQNRSIVAENLTIQGLSNGDYFDIGIEATGGRRSLFNNITYIGNYNGSDSTLANNSANFQSNCGILLDDTYAPVVENSSFKGSAVGVRMISSLTPEDGAVSYCTFTYCRTGVEFKIATGGREPQLLVNGCTFRTRDYGVDVEGRRCLFIAENIFKRLTTNHSLVDINIQNTRIATVYANEFIGPKSNRLFIESNSSSKDILFTDNTFAGSALSNPGGASDFLAINNNR